MNVTPRHSRRHNVEQGVFSPEKVQQSKTEAFGSAGSDAKVLDWYSSDAKPMPEEGTLRDFDLDVRYGPCCSVSRLERWDRAVKLGLNPPKDISSIIERTANRESVLDVHLRSISMSGSFR